MGKTVRADGFAITIHQTNSIRMENLLYYPYINIPKNDWAARVLLYYERIGSIVPQRYLYGEFDPYMKELVENRLVEPINPIVVLEHPWDVARPFIDYLRRNEFNIEKRRKASYGHSKSRTGTSSYRGTTKIHADKFDSQVFYELEQAGLAHKLDGEWYLVERTTANELMIYLASVIGHKIQFLPTTDRQQRRFNTVGLKAVSRSLETADNKREVILDELMPFPDQIDLKRLRQFKEEHLGLLKAFKNRVELIVLNRSIKIDTPEFKERVRELTIRKEELTAKMGEKKLGKIIFGTVCGIVGAGIGLATTSSVNGAILGVPGFANAIYTALQIERPEDIFDQSGLKYLALLDKQLRVPKPG